MKRFVIAGLIVAAIAGTTITDATADTPGVIYKEGTVKAKMIDAGFYYGDSNYHAIHYASDGNVYYVICSHNKKSGAKLFRYNPRSGAVDEIGDLTDIVGEDRTKVINQGKVHSDIFEVDGILYFGTHAGSYDKTYPGGHFMSYDLASGKFTDFGIGKDHQGLVAMSMDTKRMRMYAITWPGYNFVYYDVRNKKMEEWEESYARLIEQGARSIGIDPNTGNAYWHNMDGTITCFNYDKNTMSTLDKPRFDAPMFQVPIPENVGHVWRSIRWNDRMNRFYGVTYYSDWLFSYDPVTADIEIIDRIASAPNRKSGATYYSSLAFEFSKDGSTVYYIAPNIAPGSDPDKPTDELHLVTYNVVERRYIDHGVIELTDGRRPRYCQGLEVGGDGNIYIVCWIPIPDHESAKAKKYIDILTDGKPTLEIERSQTLQEINLIAFPDPFAR